ncbi:MAG TPA: hypothetical protein VKU39_20855 [Streptosporangiaceae bacterium]|nr:hypothetical protein [Streptosporangiaceae bacterium]
MSALPAAVPRMTKVAWYKHRAAVLGIPGLFVLAIGLLVIDGLMQRAWISAHHVGACLTSFQLWPDHSPCQSPVWYLHVSPPRTEFIVLALALLITAVGLFVGVPWVAREFESGAFRYTWTQSVTPWRWLFGTFGTLVLLAAAAAALCGLAAHWWYQVAQWTGGIYDAWSVESFELTPLSIVSWTLLAMALALLLGVTIRRVLPAMLAFLAVWGGCVVFAQLWLRSHLFAVGELARRTSFDHGWALPWNSYFGGTWFTRSDGRRVDMFTVIQQMYAKGPVDADRWLAQHHYGYWISYQPPDRLIWFQLARNGMLVVVAVLAVLAAVWWLRRRPAE